MSFLHLAYWMAGTWSGAATSEFWVQLISFRWDKLCLPANFYGGGTRCRGKLTYFKAGCWSRVLFWWEVKVHGCQEYMWTMSGVCHLWVGAVVSVASSSGTGKLPFWAPFQAVHLKFSLQGNQASCRWGGGTEYLGFALKWRLDKMCCSSRPWLVKTTSSVLS